MPLIKPALFASFIVACITAQLFISVASAENISSATRDILKFQQRLAEKGNVKAQFKLASMYEFGIGTEMNLKKANDWYAKAAGNGSVPAENRLLYLEIRMNGFDKKIHTNWLNKIKKNVDAGNQQAAMLLGEMYSYGIGVEKDLDQAIRLLNQAGVFQNPVVPYEIGRVENERSQLARQKRQQQVKKQQETIKMSQSKKKTDTMAEKRRRYEEVMRKIREEEQIIEQQQAWSEGKRAVP